MASQTRHGIFLWRTAALLGFAGVALGAFGAHGLEASLDDRGTALWETATLYLLVHAAAALGVGAAPVTGRWTHIAGWGFLFGGALFSGSLYLLALGAPSVLGMVAPVGGLSFLAGWVGVAAATFSRSGRMSGQGY